MKKLILLTLSIIAITNTSIACASNPVVGQQPVKVTVRYAQDYEPATVIVDVVVSDYFRNDMLSVIARSEYDQYPVLTQEVIIVKGGLVRIAYKGLRAAKYTVIATVVHNGVARTDQAKFRVFRKES